MPEFDRTVTAEFTDFFERNPNLITILSYGDASLEEAVTYLRREREQAKSFTNQLQSALSPLSAAGFTLTAGIAKMVGNKEFGTSSVAKDTKEFYQMTSKPCKVHAERKLRVRLTNFAFAYEIWLKCYKHEIEMCKQALAERNEQIANGRTLGFSDTQLETLIPKTLEPVADIVDRFKKKKPTLTLN